MRVYVVVAAAAIAAAGAAIGITLATRSAPPPVLVRQAGVPPLALDLGVRADSEARALAQATQLYDRGRRPEAGAIFARYDSLEAQVGAALAGWPSGSMARLQALATDNPRSALVRFYLGLAQLWEGRTAEATASFRAARRVQPDSFYAVRADGLLHPRFAPLLPPFTPSFALPPTIARLPAARQLEALRAAAPSSPAMRLLYGSALQRLGRPLSAERQFRLAAKEAPNDPEALTAAAVGSFSKSDPSKAFSQLGPLGKRFPQAATVRFHLGLMLLWMANVDEAKVQLARAVRLDPDGPLAPSARAFLDRLRNVRTK
jgi:tetratricopeptide (TPR) repeat protein